MRIPVIDNVKHYSPIDCNYYDILLDRATRKSMVEIQYRDGEDVVVISDRITDVYTQNSAEYLKTALGTIIRLDRILQVDNVSPPKNNGCKIG